MRNITDIKYKAFHSEGTTNWSLVGYQTRQYIIRNVFLLFVGFGNFTTIRYPQKNQRLFTWLKDNVYQKKCIVSICSKDCRGLYVKSYGTLSYGAHRVDKNGQEITTQYYIWDVSSIFPSFLLDKCKLPMSSLPFFLVANVNRIRY